jgi:hypothetical protein
MATREQVLAAYAANPKAEAVPDQASINFWMNNDLSQFNSVVDAVRAANPVLAAQIDTTRAATTGSSPTTAIGTPIDVTKATVKSPSEVFFPSGILTDRSNPQVAQVNIAPVDPTVKLFQDTLGRSPTQGEIERFGGDIKAGQLSNFLGYARNEAVNTLPSTGAAANIASQILSQGTTDKWVGEGYGSTTKNAYDMGVMLAGQGIKDINDFGQRTTANGETEFFNKATGEAIKPFYDRAGDNIWGGTFAGKDSTAYGVEFDASGKPLFYSQSGGDSADVPKWVKPALILGAAYLGLDAAGLLSGGAGAAGSLTAGFTPAQIAAAELGLPSISSGAGLLSAGGGSLTAGLTAAQIAAAEAALPTLGGSLTAGLTAADIAALEAGLPTSGSLTTGMTIADIVASEAGLPGAGFGAASLLGGAVPTGGVPPIIPTTGLPPSVTTPLVNAGVSSVVNSVLGGGGTNLGNLLNTGLTTGAGLLQQQTSREAAIAAQKMIDAETAAAKQAAAFRPVGMTTRFGTSQFGFDPKTGQLTSAGYTLSPEAKAQQDRFITLSNAGLTQAEGAQKAFAPLETGAQSLFTLGNKYLAQTPEDVAKNYLTQQMALLQPGRELELANLQNRLQQQGRGGLAVAQGGTLGATTPELQALYNARATQEAQLAANAQQAGQQQVTFGAGLLGQGAGAMGQYYAGQQAAYAPYTTAMGQAQALEAAGQQPFTLSSQLGQAASTAGARVGTLGLEGANISQRLATGAAATTNPYATALGGATSNPAFAQLLGNLTSGLFSGTPQASLTTGFTPSSIAATEAGYPSLYY